MSSSSPRQLVFFATLCLARMPALAIGCDELGAGIDARMRANGLSNFSLSVVDVAASAPGKVVGTCAQGARKIVYTAARPSDHPARNSERSPIVTECDDGRQVTNGPCKP